MTELMATPRVRDASRVLIYNKKTNKILFIRRLRGEELFYVPPGGAIEPGETPEQAAVREAKEETNINIELDRGLFVLSDTFRGKLLKTHFFLSTRFTGEDDIRLNGEELARVSPTNTFDHVWLSMNELDDKTLYPVGLREQLEKVRF